MFRYLPSATAVTQLMIVLALLAITGCEQEPVITRTKVPKQPQATAEDRMLAAIVPAKGRGWFVKLSGNRRAIEKEQDKFVELLSTLTVDGEKLNWKIPEGWSEKGGNEMRAATLVAGDSKLEIAISFLPAEDATADDYLIANINRWRGQIGLANIGAADLPKEPKDSGELRLLKLKDGTPVTWVNLEGTMSGGSPMAPFAGGAPFANRPGSGMRKPSAGPSEEDSKPEPSGDEFTYKKPDNWKVGKTGQFRKAAFEVTDGKAAIEITVSSLAKEGSDLLANINRWRGQLALESYNPAGLEKAMSPISIGKNEGHFIEMNNDREAILGAIVIVGDQGWFFKLKGDRELAMREKDNFQTFVRSMQFKSASQPGGGVRQPAAGPSEDSKPERPGEEFTYKKPDNWKVGKPGQFRKAAFEVTDGKAAIEITVSSLAKEGSGLLANINRWRGQLALESYDQAGLEKAMSPISIGKDEGHFIEMNNDREAILGAIVIVGDQGWFFKLKGDRELAMREKDNFQSFVRSMQFK